MTVATAMFTRFIPFFGGNRESYHSESQELRGVTGVAGERGLQFSREQDGAIKRIHIPYAQVLCWSPPTEKVAPPQPAKGAK